MKKLNNSLTCTAKAILPVLLISAGNVAADTQTLKCKLYIAASMDKEAQSLIELEEIGETLQTRRRASVCIFENGSIADKQFTLLNRIVGDGSTGSSMGFSVYTMENGDSLSAQFAGLWDKDGFKGNYTILGGTGGFSGASGDGSIAGSESPWATTEVVDIVLNVTTP